MFLNILIDFDYEFNYSGNYAVFISAAVNI